MSFYTVKLAANKSIVLTVAGSVILVDDLGGAPGIDIMPSYGGRDLPKMPNRKKAFKFSEPFDAVTLTAPVDCTVALFLSKNDVDLGFADGSLVNVSGEVSITNTAGSRVPVDIGGGNVSVNAANVGINNTDANAVPVRAAAMTVLSTLAAKVINTGAAQVVSNDATLKSLCLRNTSTGAVIALGAADVTLANAAITLQPGEMWIEDQAAGAAWYATSDTNGATLTGMGKK